MATVDLRRFKDVLQPVRRQRAWELDAALAALARLRVQERESEECLQAARQELREQAVLASRALEGRIDPASHESILAYLQEQIAGEERLQQQFAEIAQARMKAQSDVIGKQRMVDALEQHRLDAIAEFRIEEERKSASIDDQEWVMRRAFRDGAAA